MNGPRRSPMRFARLAVVGVLICTLAGTAAVWTNTFGAGDRFDHLMTRIRLIVNPPPDRPIQQTLEITPRPVGSAVAVADTPAPGTTPAPDSTPAPLTTIVPGSTPNAAETPNPAETPGPTPQRVPVNVKLTTNPNTMFVSEIKDVWCAPAGVQTTLAILGLADNSDAFQRRLAGRIGEWESRRDALDGGWGPAAIAAALAAYGAPGYQVRAYQDRPTALADAAVALSTTHSPVIIMAWRGAHTWVMTGYRADADPAVFADANVTGTYIYDPWYPRISSIWGPSDPPGTFQDMSEMRRNFLEWQRPEGNYPGRDGHYILVVPTVAAGSAPQP